MVVSLYAMFVFHGVSNATPIQTVPCIASATSRFPVRASCRVLAIFAGFGERGGPEAPRFAPDARGERRLERRVGELCDACRPPPRSPTPQRTPRAVATSTRPWRSCAARSAWSRRACPRSSAWATSSRSAATPRAQRPLTAWRQAAPHSFEAHANAGLLAAEQPGRRAAALAHLRAALAINPSWGDGCYNLANLLSAYEATTAS